MEPELVRVLLVEDNAGDAYLFRKALEEAHLNFTLTVIDDGFKALAFVRSEGEYAISTVPDLIVLDLNLPKHGGVEVLKAIQQSRRFDGVPVVITSSSLSPPRLTESERLRVTRYIPKPPDLDEFLAIGPELEKVFLEAKARAPKSASPGKEGSAPGPDEHP
jgi:CheY-like chemotaxis protein